MTPQEIVDAVADANRVRNRAVQELDRIRNVHQLELQQLCAASTGHVFSYTRDSWVYLSGRECVFCGATELKEA